MEVSTYPDDDYLAGGVLYPVCFTEITVLLNDDVTPLPGSAGRADPELLRSGSGLFVKS